MITNRQILLLSMGLMAAILLSSIAGEVRAATDAVKVFILAGQSNMEGKAANSLMDYQATDPGTKDFFAHFRNGDAWAVRDDVFIKFLDRKGPLTIGYGSPNRTGAELEFGWVMGDHFEEPVLLIKAAWGGHSLYQLFRSPSAGLPREQILEKELENAKKRNPNATMAQIKEKYGNSYRNMMKEVKEVRENYQTLFPQLKSKRFDIAGFFWFQGFNDQWGEAPKEYESNMKHFIKDVRKDLGEPKLPFVIAAIGTGGSKHPKDHPVMLAQMAMNDVPEFKGNVKAFRTDVLVDKAAERLFPNWEKHFEEWNKVGSDRPYHYLGSAIWYTRIGRAAGEAMVELIEGK
jgi:hypothetical protein